MPQSVVALIPPWVVFAALVGAMHGALFHLFFADHVRRLPGIVLLGLAAGVAGGLLGTMIPPAIFAIGDTNLIATSLCAWVALGLSRLFRFC